MNLEKSVHAALWGSESWEISAHPSDSNEISGGECKGRTLREVYPKFPLLFKVIDAKTRLSVQVHPNEETCNVTGGEPKAEMWCALSDGPIYAGVKKGTSAADVEAAVKSGRFEELLVRHGAKFGEMNLEGKRVMERMSVLIPPSSTCELFATDSLLFLTRFKGGE